MRYVELDLPDEIYERLEQESDEEGMSVEDLITDILKNEISGDENKDNDFEDEDVCDDELDN